MNGDSSAAAGALLIVGLECLFAVAVYAFLAFLCWRIFSKTGQSGALGLIALIPGIGLLVLLCILAFGTWPIEQRLMQSGMMQGNMPPPAPGYSSNPYPPTQYPPYPPQ